MWLDVAIAVGIVFVFAWAACRFVSDLERQVDSAWVDAHERIGRKDES
jgi:uncharacterized BrkB/YihY/UPF0761 family membrane protein